jgi:hypothetical protein
MSKAVVEEKKIEKSANCVILLISSQPCINANF